MSISAFLRRRVAFVVVGACTALSACSLTTDPGDQPTSAVIKVTGSAPSSLTLIVSTDFFEQINLESGARYPIIESADTVQISLPYERTVDLRPYGSIYVQLYYEPVSPANVEMSVDIDNGQGYKQAATLSTQSSLIYYFVYDPLR